MKHAYVLAIWLVVLFLSARCGKAPDPTPIPAQDSSVQVGTPAVEGQESFWTCARPDTVISNPRIAQPRIAAKKTDTCTLTVTTPCGSSKASVAVTVYRQNPDGSLVEVID